MPRLRSIGWLSTAVFLFVLLSSQSSLASEIDLDVGEVLRSIAEEAELDHLPCARDGRLEVPISFRYRKQPSDRASGFSFAIPGDDASVLEVLGAFRGYPEWFLRRRDGRPNLHAFEVDSDGRGYLQVAASDGFRLRTEIRDLDAGGYRGVDLDIDAGWGVLKGRLLLAVRPSNLCDRSSSEVVGSLTWRMGLLGRLLPSSLKNLPGALALAIRDDLLARLLEDDGEQSEDVAAWPGEAKEPSGARVLRPWVFEGLGGPAESELLGDYLGAVSGSYLVTGWWSPAQGPGGEARDAVASSGGRSYRYELDLVMKRRGYDLFRSWRPEQLEEVARRSIP